MIMSRYHLERLVARVASGMSTEADAAALRKLLGLHEQKATQETCDKASPDRDIRPDFCA